jgi:hypothetical protein
VLVHGDQFWLNSQLYARPAFLTTGAALAEGVADRFVTDDAGVTLDEAGLDVVDAGFDVVDAGLDVVDAGLTVTVLVNVWVVILVVVLAVHLAEDVVVARATKRWFPGPLCCIDLIPERKTLSFSTPARPATDVPPGLTAGRASTTALEPPKTARIAKEMAEDNEKCMSDQPI